MTEEDLIKAYNELTKTALRLDQMVKEKQQEIEQLKKELEKNKE